MIRIWFLYVDIWIGYSVIFVVLYASDMLSKFKGCLWALAVGICWCLIKIQVNEVEHWKLFSIYFISITSHVQHSWMFHNNSFLPHTHIFGFSIKQNIWRERKTSAIHIKMFIQWLISRRKWWNTCLCCCKSSLFSVVIWRPPHTSSTAIEWCSRKNCVLVALMYNLFCSYPWNVFHCLMYTVS